MGNSHSESDLSLQTDSYCNKHIIVETPVRYTDNETTGTFKIGYWGSQCPIR